LKNTPLFIAQRIGKENKNGFSVLITRIAIASIAVGIAVMDMSFFIYKGFKGEIQEKIFSFAAHVQVVKYNTSNAYEGIPITTKRKLFQQKNANIAHIQRFALKPALLKTDIEVMGTLLKGVGTDYDTVGFKKNIVEGRFIRFADSAYSKEILISRFVADKLQLRLHDQLLVYFIQEPPRFRKLNIVGIYETGMEDFDQKIILGDLRLIQRLNNWQSEQVGGFEIFVPNFDQLDPHFEAIYENLDYDLQASKVSDQYAHFFDWFLMLNQNVLIFLGIILFVACFNTSSILLILVMERTYMIGILKALGANNAFIRQIFVWNGFRIMFKGLLIGNLLAFFLAFVQKYFQLVPLNPEHYYMRAVPIWWDWQAVLASNLLLILVISVFLWLPTLIISQFRPIQSIRFD